MKNIFLFSAILVTLFSCSTPGTIETTTEADSLNSVTPTEFKGLFANGKFIWCDNPRVVYTVEDETHTLDTLYAKTLPNAYPKQTIFIEVKGKMPPDRSKDVLVVTEVIKAEAKNVENTCIKFDYWCHGNEPFWQVYISEEEDLIDLYEPMDQRSTHFTYSAPEIKDNKTVYTAKNGNDFMQVIISNEFCSDGMSEKKYNFKAEVQMNGKKWTGCAVKYGEPVK